MNGANPALARLVGGGPAARGEAGEVAHARLLEAAADDVLSAPPRRTRGPGASYARLLAVPGTGADDGADLGVLDQYRLY